MMRGTDETSGSLFSYVDLEERIPARHPLRKIRQVVNDALASLDAEFEALYTDFGRPSIAPERLIRASLLQILFSVRSERQLMEQMQYNSECRRRGRYRFSDPASPETGWWKPIDSQDYRHVASPYGTKQYFLSKSCSVGRQHQRGCPRRLCFPFSSSIRPIAIRVGAGTSESRGGPCRRALGLGCNDWLEPFIGAQS